MEKANSAAPEVNILETEEDYKVEIAAPGLTKEDFRINIGDNVELTVFGEKKSEYKEEGRKKGKPPLKNREYHPAVK